MSRLAGFYHDVGFAKLNPALEEHNQLIAGEEKRIIQTHPRLGLELARSAGLSKNIQKAILSHHECFDGSGYPNGWTKDKIPLLARIVCVADQFVSLINTTGSSPGLSPQLAYTALQASTKLDPSLLKTLGQVLKLS